jgi:solute:Na+ symporter, SSS family
MRSRDLIRNGFASRKKASRVAVVDAVKHAPRRTTRAAANASGALDCLRLLRRAALVALAALYSMSDAKVMNIAWDELPPLPPSAGKSKQPGVAGPFVGVHGDVLIVAGGANFPDKMPWEGGAKAWWDDIWVLEKSPDGTVRWMTDKKFKLPRALAYGVSVSVPEGVICAGGSDADRCYADVYLLSWDAREREIRCTPLPSMPEPLAFMAGALANRTLYVAGGQHVMKGAVASAAFWSLDWSKRDRGGDFKWVALASWPGPPRIVPVAAAQRRGDAEAFFLFSGRAPDPGRPTKILTDAYAFEPLTGGWRTVPNVNGGAGVSVMAGAAVSVGDDEILVFSGDRGELFLALEAHDLAIEALRRRSAELPANGRAEVDREIADRLAAKKKIYDTHPGFAREVLAYDTQRETWRVAARSPLAGQVTTFAVKWNDAIVIPSGEIRPGVRTSTIVRAKPVDN